MTVIQGLIASISTSSGIPQSIGPMNSAFTGGGPGIVYFDRSIYPSVDTVPIGATMSSAIFASPVTITASQVWVDPAYWYVGYDAPPGTPNTDLSQTFTITWTI